MDDLLANPAVQAAAAPFLAALVVASALLRTRIAGLAICVGLAVVAGLAIGVSVFVEGNLTLLGVTKPLKLNGFNPQPAASRSAGAAQRNRAGRHSA